MHCECDHWRGSIKWIRTNTYHRSTSAEETSIRYVAEDNIKIITPEVPRVLMSAAGRYFKRWECAR
jgi:hypothetical protein